MIFSELESDSDSDGEADNSDDLENGPDGDDTVPVDLPEAVSIVGTDDDDSIRLPTAGSFIAQGGDGDDRFLDRLAGDEVLPGNAEDDTGPVTIEGGSGDDLIRLDDAFDNIGERSIDLGEGNETLAVTLDRDHTSQAISIEDFDENEDMLVFEFPGNLDRRLALQDAGEVTCELSQNAVDGTSDTAVTATLSSEAKEMIP